MPELYNPRYRVAADLLRLGLTLKPSATQRGQSYFGSCAAGTRNVIVASGYTDRSAALAKVQSLCSKFPEFRFKLFDTVARDGKSNEHFAVIVGHGLNQAEAQALVTRVRSAGVAANAYHTSQDWNADCDDQSAVER